VLVRLQSDPAFNGTPVIVLSADATAGRVERLLETGATAYLSKPIDVRRFLEVIDEHAPPMAVGTIV
jgi:CheY-like chemotaxis protein